MDYLSGDLELSLQPREDQVSYIAHGLTVLQMTLTQSFILWNRATEAGPQDAFPPWHVLPLSLLPRCCRVSQPSTSVMVTAGYHKAGTRQ